MNMKPIKPLGIKSYGSIPHLPNSRMGVGDHHCHEGQARIATIKTRDKNDWVLVQEKLDGANVGVAKINGCIVALSRSGYEAKTSPYIQHHKFAEWVELNKSRFETTLLDGQRLCGEWLIQAHGTRYNLPHEPFVAFDLITGSHRHIYNEFLDAIERGSFVPPMVLSMGQAFGVESALECLKHSGHGAIDTVEGAIWRVERNSKVDFLVKYVRPDKQDGKYLPEISGNEPVWNTII